MRVGWIGLGKLGLPCALVLADSGHDVIGYDAVETVNQAVDKKSLDRLPYVEPGALELLWQVDAGPGDGTFRVAFDLRELVLHSDVVFVAVQTPHAPHYDGSVPVPEQTRDFEYGYLVQAVRQVVTEAQRAERELVLVVVSTVMPGTTDRLLRPIVDLTRVALVYSPQFIAMGSTVWDFKNPEFLLLGSDHPTAAGNVSDVFAAVHDAPRYACSIADAEAIKVLYNTYISTKIVWANHVAGICDATGADADRVVGALELATSRVVSPAYLRPGMGDGGACHPRDLIALADLERRHDLPPFFTSLSQWRDLQSQQLANLVVRWAEQTGLHEVILLGQAYKPEVPLEDGSPARLLYHQLAPFIQHGVGKIWLDDPYSRPHIESTRERIEAGPAVVVHCTQHPQYQGLSFPPGSVVIDPWGTLPQTSPGVVYVRPGRR